MPRFFHLLVALFCCLSLCACQGGFIPENTHWSRDNIPLNKMPREAHQENYAKGQIPKPPTYKDGDSPDRLLDVKSDAKPAGFAPAPPGDGFEGYLNQKLHWEDCDGYQCTTFLAPLDWENPHDQAITIAMKRSPAANKSKGVLFINPGGPGGSAQDYVDSFYTDDLPNYDVIGLDSRGSGQSTPVVCGDGPQTDAFFQLDASPDDQGESDALIEGQKKFNTQCREHSGDLLDHISTVETVYDYDLARQLLHQKVINFYGVSYGTYLGAVYAQLFPKNVRRMVLDSAVDISKDNEVIQAEGFDLSLRNYAKWCAKTQCGLGDSEDAVVAKVQQFLDELDSHPLATSSDRELNQTLGVSGLVVFFYFGADIYEDLSFALLSAINQHDGTILLQAADSMNERNPDGSYSSLMYSFPAISCADRSDKGIKYAFDEWSENDSKRAPIFGKFFGPDLVCPLWTAKGRDPIEFDGKGAPPILIVQNTGDSATPFENAVRMNESLESSVLLVHEGPGHGVYQGSSECADKFINDYLNKGVLPPEGTRCKD